MLYVVPTPIGNLRDLTYRAVDVLKEADVIVCEDTRQTPKLLRHYDIKTRDGVTPSLLSFHEHSSPGRIAEIVALLREGKKVVLVTDGGTPLISDPGFEVVREAIVNGFEVQSLPGPTACLTALAASGLAVDRFAFFGFLPQKTGGRKKIFEEVKEERGTLIFYESPYRLVKALQDMKTVFGDREAVVARELTKKFEEYRRGTVSKLIEHFSKKKVLGEIVILVSGHGRKKLWA